LVKEIELARKSTYRNQVCSLRNLQAG